MKVLIIPDVHGRKFWREAIEKYPDLQRVFLGDYVDPYFWLEGINMETAVKEFEDILNLDPSKTTLLYGNHDTHYIWDEAEHSSRYDGSWREKLQEMYASAEFKIAHQIGDYLLTHAGVTRKWFEQNKFEIPEEIDKFLNNLTLTEEGRRALTDCGFSRGGRAPSGGPVWADWYEDHTWWKDEIKPGLKQIFGHTQVLQAQNYKTSWCIDTKRAYILDTDEGTIKEA